MLTQLRFKNWRSLRNEVVIKDLTPITVFIGANSTGKTNILDALHFMRHSVNNGIVSGVKNWGGRHSIRTLGTNDNAIVELEYSLKLHNDPNPITELLALKFEGRDIPFLFG